MKQEVFCLCASGALEPRPRPQTSACPSNGFSQRGKIMKTISRIGVCVGLCLVLLLVGGDAWCARKLSRAELAKIERQLASVSSYDEMAFKGAIFKLCDDGGAQANQLLIDYIVNYDSIANRDIEIRGDLSTDCNGGVHSGGQTNREYALQSLGCFITPMTRRFLEKFVLDESNHPSETRKALETYQLMDGDKKLVMYTMRRLVDRGESGFVQTIRYQTGVPCERCAIEVYFNPEYLPTYQYLLDHLRRDVWRLQVIAFLDDFGQNSLTKPYIDRIRKKLNDGGYAYAADPNDTECQIRRALDDGDYRY